MRRKSRAWLLRATRHIFSGRSRSPRCAHRAYCEKGQGGSMPGSGPYGSAYSPRRRDSATNQLRLILVRSNVGNAAG